MSRELAGVSATSAHGDEKIELPYNPGAVSRIDISWISAVFGNVCEPPDGMVTEPPTPAFALQSFRSFAAGPYWTSIELGDLFVMVEFLSRIGMVSSCCPRVEIKKLQAHVRLSTAHMLCLSRWFGFALIPACKHRIVEPALR